MFALLEVKESKHVLLFVEAKSSTGQPADHLDTRGKANAKLVTLRLKSILFTTDCVWPNLKQREGEHFCEPLRAYICIFELKAKHRLHFLLASQ